MSARWAARLPARAAARAGRLRLVPGVVAALDGDTLWLTGEPLEPALERLLRSVAGAERFTITGAGDLVRPGRIVPSGGALPRGGWTSLDRLLVPQPPVSIAPGAIPSCIPIRVIRGGPPREPAILLTTIERWSAWALAAAAVRLDRLTFAVAKDGTALVRGQPLPPLPGRRMVEADSVGVPCGWTWSPAVEPAVVRLAAGADPGDLVVLSEEGTADVVPAEALARATRATVRQTCAGAGRG